MFDESGNIREDRRKSEAARLKRDEKIEEDKEKLYKNTMKHSTRQERKWVDVKINK